MTVVVTGDRIAAVGRTDSVPVPAGAEVIDAADRYLIPGLWDMHAHVFSDRAWWESFLPLVVANGVTGIREMRWGVSAEAVRALEAGEVVAPPRIVAAGNMIVGHRSGWPATQVARSPEEARALVDSLHAVGAPFLKIMSDLSLGTYGAISERARSLGIPFVGHVPMDVRAADASDAGQHSMEHLLGLVEGCSSEEEAIIARYGVAAIFPEGEYDEARYLERIERALATQDDDRCRALAARFVENDTWQVPTLVTLRGLHSRYDGPARDAARLRYLSPSQLRELGWFPTTDTTRIGRERARIRRAQFARQKEIVGMLAAARVPFLAGTDAPEPGAFPGFGLHDELGLLVEAGLTPLQALQSATLNPARFLGRTDDLGTVEAGKLADLVLLDANPLEDIGNTRRIRAVVVDGRLLERPALTPGQAYFRLAAWRTECILAP